ncbi:MAG TPA: PilZ domain-containing protein [Blastocatellia bacterium]|nr:PilZ domain-containing protein [Blastocatellia bacterium]
MIERRSAKRFQVDWQVRVEGCVDGGESFVESGVLRNISSNGALVSLPRRLCEGATIDVFIKLPVQKEKWMKYPARVVRVERGVAAVAAVGFDTTRPDFRSPVGPGS